MKHLIYLLLLALHATQYVGGFPAGGTGNATDHVGNAGNNTDHVERVTQDMEPPRVAKNDTDPEERATNDTDLFLLVNTKTGHNLSDRFLEYDISQHEPNSTTKDHLANFNDFSSWNKEDIHEFNLNNGNDISREQLTFLDQLAVETEQHVLANKSHIAGEVITQHDTPGSDQVQVKPINTKESSQRIKTENKDQEGEDDTNRSLSLNRDIAQGIYSDNIQHGIKDNNLHRDNQEFNDRENEALLKKFQEQYEKDPGSLSKYLKLPTSEKELPLISVSKIDPFSVTLAVKPDSFDVYTMVRLMYERVPVSKPALPQNLDDPVIEYVPMFRGEQEHRLYNLPVGKYIICGEAFAKGEVFQANCVEAHVAKHSTKHLQGGVVCVVAIALLIVFVVIVYAIYHRVVIYKLEKEN